MSDQLLTLDEAAGRMGRSYQWLYHLVTTGKLPSQRVGKMFVVLAADVDNYEHQPRGKPPAKPIAETKTQASTKRSKTKTRVNGRR